MLNQILLSVSSGGGNMSAAQPLDLNAQFMVLGAIAFGLVLLAYFFGNMAVIYSED